MESFMLKSSVSAAALIAALLVTPALAQTSSSPSAPANPTATARPAVSADQFVNQAANSGMFEVQSSQAAETKSQDQKIRDFAQRMVQDHTKANEQLKSAAGNHTVPTSLDQEHSSMLQQLQQASGADFNRKYVQMQYDGHEKAVQLFDSYSRSGDDNSLKQFASQTLPTLRTHLQMITQIRDQMSSPDRTASNNAGAKPGFVTNLQPGVWRATKLNGVDVYNANNEKIGDISDVIVDTEGKAKAVVIGVGGFLGLGERDVAVPFDALQWTDNNNNNNSTTSSGAPSRVVLPHASKDELKSAPQFKRS